MEIFTLSSDSRDARTHVSSRRALAEVLGCSETTVARMLIEPGNPGKTLNGSYRVEPWKNYYAARSREAEDADDSLGGATVSLSSELKMEQAALVRAKRRKAELDLRAREGELLEIAVVEKQAFEFAAALAAQHKRSATVDLFNSLCSLLRVEKEDVPALLDALEKFHDDFCRKVQEFRMTDAPQA